MAIVLQVAKQGSFTRAAQTLDMTVSTVSKSVAQLESLLGIELLHRTTRSCQLTALGRAYTQGAEEILERIQHLEDSLVSSDARPSGEIRVTAPTAYGRMVLGPALPKFAAGFPELRVDLELTDEVIDLSDTNIDVAIRSSEKLPDSNLFHTLLGEQSKVLVAAPGYLRARGEPESPADLADHRWLGYRTLRQTGAVQLRDDAGRDIVVHPTACYSSNSYDVLIDAALAGTGIVNAHHYQVHEALEDGRLVSVLPDWHQPKYRRYAVYKQRRNSSAKLRVFVEFLRGLAA